MFSPRGPLTSGVVHKGKNGPLLRGRVFTGAPLDIFTQARIGGGGGQPALASPANNLFSCRSPPPLPPRGVVKKGPADAQPPPVVPLCGWGGRWGPGQCLELLQHCPTFVAEKAFQTVSWAADLVKEAFRPAAGREGGWGFNPPPELVLVQLGTVPMVFIAVARWLFIGLSTVSPRTHSDSEQLRAVSRGGIDEEGG